MKESTKERSAFKRLVELDSLRGIAAISVVMAHLTLSLPKENNFFRLGVSGVDLFFLISGYVIYMSFERITKSSEFIISRIGRLFPVYWLAVTGTFLLFYFWSRYTGMPQIYSLNSLFTNLTMFQYYFKSTNVLAVSWTLLIEMLFYIFMLGLFRIRLLHKIEIIIAISLLPIFLYAIYLEGAAPHIYKIMHYYFPLLNHLPLFYAGILFYRINNVKLTALRIALIFACFSLQSMLFFHGGSDKDFMTQKEYIIILLIFFSLFALLTIKKLSFINNPIILFLGKISYSLYLIHLYPSGLIIAFFTNTKYFHLNFWIVIILIVLPFLFFTAYLLYKYIELPGIRISKNLIYKKSKWRDLKFGKSNQINFDTQLK